jgi:hypothetical protein
MFRKLVLAISLSPVVWAQSAAPPSTPAASNAGAPAAQGQQPPASGTSDDLAQMRIDLDHMESLLNNMNSEITFLRDQNLQILLNTNSRMWTMLIRDLRLQINREEQHRTHAPELPMATRPESDKPATGTKPK